MGGLIKWLKKDGSSRNRRRESAPLQSFSKQQPVTDSVYRENIKRFTTFRETERIQRLSMGANDLDGYHSIESMPSGSRTPTDQRQEPFASISTCPPKAYRSQSVSEDRSGIHSLQPGHRTKKFTVQFHLNESTDESEMNMDTTRSSRHSMPAVSSNGYARAMRRTQNIIDSTTIREEEIEEFEGAHCTYSNSVNEAEQSGYHSPPTKFYKQNQNPYPSNSETSSLSTLFETQPMHVKCPEKPKRLLLNNQQARKLLTEAHFTGDYRNFEMKSPYYSDSSSVFSTIEKPLPGLTDTESYATNIEATPQQNQYQVIVNKHGDEVEYALPCVDVPEYQRRQKLPNCLTSDDSILAGEVFNEDPIDCDRLLNENFESSNASISIHEVSSTSEQRVKGRIMITDLDKSTDSCNTLDELESMTRAERINDLNAEMKTPNRIVQYRDSMRNLDHHCLMSDVSSTGKMEAKVETALHFEWGSYKKTDVTIRRYADLDIDDNNVDFTLIAETAIIRDAEVLRKIRHENIINLMAIAFDPSRRLALIMQPTKHSLNHQVFVKNEQLELADVVTVVKCIAGAVVYLQEFGICHSNISSHSIMVGNDIAQVKLTSFELAVPYDSDAPDVVELKLMQHTKRVPATNPNPSPKKSLSPKQKIERYRSLTKNAAELNSALDSSYCVPFIREISPKYFPYCTEYRRKLAVFNYQPPELLSQTERFVFPTKQSDNYALTLLLWELLNQCIPFIIYDEAKLDELLKTNYPYKYLTIVEEERCQRFHEILERGLKREPDTRIELDVMIRKLTAIESEIHRENEKDETVAKCCCMKPPSGKSLQRRSIHENMKEAFDKMTPDKSTSKLFSIITSPKASPVAVFHTRSIEKTLSPLNNVTNNTFHNSILDFNKLLSPRRDTNDQRSSTLKKRKKITPNKCVKRNVRDLFGDDLTDDRGCNEPKAVFVGKRFSEPNITSSPAPEFNMALTKSAIFKELDYTHEDHNISNIIDKSAKKKVDQPFGPKDVSSNYFPNRNNSSYQFVIDDYELPQELIARNNKIRRCTWLSSDLVNGSMQSEPLSAASSNLQMRETLPTLNESSDSNKQMNVSIKIVHKQVTPNKNTSHNESMKSDCTTLSALSGRSDESISVKSRIKFFRSLEGQPLQDRTPVKGKMEISRRSEMSFNEAKKAIEKAQRHTYPSATQPNVNLNKQLIKEITDITADIKNCLSQNKFLSDKKTDNNEFNETELNNLLNADYTEADESVAMLIEDLLNQKSLLDVKNETFLDEVEKRNSVRATVQKFETRNEMNEVNNSFQKIDNKLLNEKIVNIDSKPDDRVAPLFYSNHKSNEKVEDEKVEDIIRFVQPSEVENEAGVQLVAQPVQQITGDSQQSQTLIKRTIYHESIISGGNVDVSDFPNVFAIPTVTSIATTRQSSLTTRVTLNMRKCTRRSSDVGLNSPRQQIELTAPHMNDIRHSISGSPIPILGRNNSVDATSGRRLDQLQVNQHSHDQLRASVSSVVSNAFNGKSIEDLYIDDDFAGIGLAANLKLLTNSTDSLDNITVDLISTQIFHQESTELSKADYIDDIDERE